MGLARIFGICAALFFASSVSAANIIDVGPSDYRNFGPAGAHTSQGIRSTFGQQVRLPPTISGPSRILPVSRNAVIPYGAAANAMRPFTAIHPASVAASAAITGLFLAMEWYFDEEIGEWSVREVESVPPIEGTGWRINSGACSYSNTGVTYPTPQAACDVAAPCQSPPREPGSVHSIRRVSSGAHVAICPLLPVGGNISLNTPAIECPHGSMFNTSEGVCQAYEPRPVIEGEFTRLAGELPNLNPGAVAQGTADAQERQGAPIPGYTDVQMSGPSSITGSETTSTTVDPVTGDTVVTTTNTTTNISYGDTTITTTNTTTSTNYQNGQETSTTVTTETPGELPVSSGGGASGEWPGFCDWARVVCDWFDWTQEDPGLEDPELPVPIDEDFYREKNISFGSKSCPPDYEITVPFINTTVAVPMQPFCDFAGIIYFMVMASAYIYAAYISVGVARNG